MSKHASSTKVVLPLAGHTLLTYRAESARAGYGDSVERYQARYYRCECGIELGEAPGFNARSIESIFSVHCLEVLGADFSERKIM